MTLPSSGPLSLNDIQGEFGGSNPIGINEYYAGGGLVPAGTSGTYGAVPTSGQISIQNFYGTSNFIPTYIEEVFSTWLYTGNGATQTITNGINLSGSGGMVWTKARSDAFDNNLYDSTRLNAGNPTFLCSNSTSVAATGGDLSSFNSNGFSLRTLTGQGNNAGTTFASWTFRKQPKFFDVVTYTGNGVVGRTIAHNLGSVPGCIIIKNTANTSNWAVYHRSLGATSGLLLNSTSAADGTYNYWNSTAPTSTVFSVDSHNNVNASGSTYVAYLFAHNAGGFGLTNTDNVISCGGFTTDPTTGFSPFINLGYEPQWVLFKQTNTTNNWQLVDNMRGLPAYTDGNNLANNPALFPNLASAQSLSVGGVAISSTGFYTTGATSSTYIYIAIRRGPMKTPTSGTSVFAPTLATGSGSATSPTYPTGFPVDLAFRGYRPGGNASFANLADRLRGASPYLVSSSTAAEVPDTNFLFDSMTGYYGPGIGANSNVIGWMFRRAPGFFDEVCYTGTGTSGLSVTHNLGVAPELVIIKCRNSTGGWAVGTQFGSTNFTFAVLNGSGAANVNQGYNTAYGFYSQPTASAFVLDAAGIVNTAGNTQVAYLFASCPGVSKVGSYSGTGATQTISCGFAARFVLIKRTDSTGNWWVWDTARGMVAGTDPRLALNSTAAETNANWVYTNASGFQIVTTDATVNASGGSYIFLAVA